MSETKKPEQILEQIMDLLRELEKCKVKAEWPIPIVKDRQGKFADAYTVKDWYLKEQEELGEFYNEVTHYADWDDVASEAKAFWVEDGRDRVLEEACDQIHVIFSKLHQFGFTEEEIAAGIRRSNEKARERGLIDEGG